MIDSVMFPAGAQPFATAFFITPDYFHAMRIALREGRMFTSSDRPTPPLLGSAPAPAGLKGRRVTAVIEAVALHQCQLQQLSTKEWPSSQFLVRTSGDPLTLYASNRRELTALNPSIPTDRISALETLVGGGLARRRLPVVLMSAFGVLALLLASVGVYAMLAAMGAAREREFGVRIALGSSRRALISLIVRQVAVWITIGLPGGAFGALVITCCAEYRHKVSR